MGKFADFYVAHPQDAGRAARSAGGSKNWPHYTINRVDVFQIADLFDLLRGGRGTDTWREFRQEPFPLSFESDGEEEDAEVEYMIGYLPGPMVGLLARLDEARRREVAGAWQDSPEFFWRNKPGTADSVLAALCELAKQAVALGQTIILVESGD